MLLTEFNSQTFSCFSFIDYNTFHAILSDIDINIQFWITLINFFLFFNIVKLVIYKPIFWVLIIQVNNVWIWLFNFSIHLSRWLRWISHLWWFNLVLSWKVNWICTVWFKLIISLQSYLFMNHLLHSWFFTWNNCFCLELLWLNFIVDFIAIITWMLPFTIMIFSCYSYSINCTIIASLSHLFLKCGIFLSFFRSIQELIHSSYLDDTLFIWLDINILFRCVWCKFAMFLL